MIINGLTTLANVKLQVGVINTSYDSILELLINRTSALIRQYLGRQITYGTYAEMLSATPRQKLLLGEYPIRSITSITSRGQVLTLNVDYRLDAQDALAGMVYKEDGWDPILLVSGLTMDIMAAARTIATTYIAGYRLPSDPLYVDGADDSLPIDIQMVADEMISERFLKIKLHAPSMKLYNEGGVRYMWETKEASTFLGISDEHAMILNQYKRFVVA